MAYVRSAGVRGVRSVIESLGGNADVLARRSGLPEGALDDDEILVQDVAIGILLETAAAELHCPDFGLRVALEQDLSMLGPLAVAIQNARTATQALEMTSKYMFFHARSLEISIIDDPAREPGVLGVRYGYRDNDVRMPQQAADMALLFVHRSISRLLGANYGLRSVLLPFQPKASPTRYRELFGAPLEPDSDDAVLRMPAALLDRPIESGGHTAQELALRYIERRAMSTGESMSERTRDMLRQSLDTGASTIAETAKLLAVSPRTLQRTLAREHTSFSAILDDVRREVATRLVTTTDLPLYQIASALALSDVTTFSQYARRWWGVTAREFRATAR